MRWLAWDPDDCDREHAIEYTASIGPDFSATIAEIHAENMWDSADAFNACTIMVVEIDDDGTETPREFHVVVDYSPTFLASEASR